MLLTKESKGRYLIKKKYEKRVNRKAFEINSPCMDISVVNIISRIGCMRWERIA